ncbi:hypothetical protein KM043_015787 [Ampulex compressa]|nr:hypothetical protein KM043_015787 [Ampulex compressa]
MQDMRSSMEKGNLPDLQTAENPSSSKENERRIGIVRKDHPQALKEHRDHGHRRKILIRNQNVNLNMQSHRHEDMDYDHDAVTCPGTEKQNEKKNQRYSSSFIWNSTNQDVNLDENFKNVLEKNSKERRVSSVHMGEDVTLCWIETTTIKEDKSVRPPKRVVIREYTISFENSATIPNR